jgi:hypothetical protein
MDGGLELLSVRVDNVPREMAMMVLAPGPASPALLMSEYSSLLLPSPASAAYSSLSVYFPDGSHSCFAIT